MNRATAQRFIRTLRARCLRDAAIAAALRRDADRTPAESRIVLERAALFHALGVSAREEATCHLIATMFAHDRGIRRHSSDGAAEGDESLPASDADASTRGTSLGATMAARVAVAPNEEPALARRLTSLLSATMEDDGSGSLAWRLRRTVLLLLSRGASIDWARLAYDVSYWNHPEQFVQREWARDFYRERPLAVAVGAASRDTADSEQDDDTIDTDD